MKQINDMRQNNVDVAKGIAIIMVVWGHVLANTTGESTAFISLVHMPVFAL